jgi:ribosomal protein L24E
MNLELLEETTPGSGTMYVVRLDGSAVKWFAHKADADKYYEEIVANPDLLKPQKNILKSQEITLSLEQTNN